MNTANKTGNQWFCFQDDFFFPGYFDPVFFYIIKTIKFRGDLSDISANKEPLPGLSKTKSETPAINVNIRIDFVLADTPVRSPQKLYILIM